jgi:hypothetical protein
MDSGVSQVPTRPTSMRELIDIARDRHHGGVSLLAKIATAAGHGISHAALSRFYNGKYRTEGLTRESIETLAYLADVPYEVARDAAHSKPKLGPFTIPAAFDALSAPERQVLLDMGHRLLEAHGGTSGDSGHSRVESDETGDKNVARATLSDMGISVGEGQEGESSVS